MHSRRQPQRIPPPIDHGEERLDAERVLREYPGGLGLALWKTARTVRLWSELEPPGREGAFSSGARERRAALLAEAVREPALRAALERAAGVLNGGEAGGGELAAACVEVSRWAERSGGPGTALEFAQAAAFASPADAALALETGRRARGVGEYARAETWSRRAIATARQTRSWRAFAGGFVELARVHALRGNATLARKSGVRAIRAAKRHSLREELADAYEVMLAQSSAPREKARYGRLLQELAPRRGNPSTG